MINFRIHFAFFFTLIIYVAKAQYNGLGFTYPLDREVIITGNYGEIRPNHFHAGLDFSTDPSVNLPIKSIGDGYVSRIKISSVGYGRVLYITHPNGYISVYAHQKKYATKIDAYIKQKQIEQKKNEIEVYPQANELQIKKGEVIGYSGNSGGSTGPHLHFEIREEKSEIPINPLLVYNIKDDIKPTITHLVIYNTRDTNNIISQMINPINNKTLKHKIILAQNTFAVGFSGFDIANATNNKNNIYEAKLKLDNQLIYHHQLNNISFDNGRYVNIFSEKLGGIKYQKCFSPTCYDINIYKTLVNGGKIELKDTLVHTLELIVSDERGNANHLIFQVKTNHLNGYTNNLTKYNVICDKSFTLKQDNFNITIPAYTLVNSIYLSKRVYIKAAVGVELGDKNIKVIKPFKMSLKINSPIKNKEAKLVMTINGDVIGGKYEDGWLQAESKAFGTFNYSYDTVAPTIIIPSSKKKKSNPKNYISFKIDDNLSGIADYNVYLNDTWQIAEYDAKSNTVTCYFTELNTQGKLRIEVIDKVGNKTVLNKTL